MIYLRKTDYSENIQKAAYMLLNEAIEKEFNLSYIQIEKDEYGKPHLVGRTDIHFSLSHTDGMVAVILSNNEVGIDIEKIRPINIRIAEKVCTQDEKDDIMRREDKDIQFLKYWTLKESYVKAIGQGLRFGLKNISFQLSADSICSNDKNAMFDLFLRDEYIVAVCCLDGNIPKIKL
ncbi:MAG: 4'-phosphopantetheinyl transferase superfamily protein [Bacillota bacterium]|nr:4'-phosphopantetheinyl transferase superfamily protein [Bacillota bacterium]